MKKLISTLTALTTITAIMPFNAVAAETDDPKLYAIADSLGADTDCLNVMNYTNSTANIMTSEEYQKYLSRCSLIEASYYPSTNYISATESSSASGISLLEILSHNGIISPADIQKNAEKLSEISYNKDLNKIITSYQSLQGYTIFHNYEKYLVTSRSYNQQIENLISTAEKCMNENRYFLITINAKDFSHAVCGMGIASGQWEWDGITFDKCILTLDSNVSGFSNKNCIYINSETYESYIPAYELNSGKNPSYTAIDDEQLLNFRGMINPSESVDENITDITHFTDNTSKTNTKISYTEENVEYDVNNPDSTEAEETENYLKADSIHAEMESEYKRFPSFRYINSDRWIDVELSTEDNAMYGDYNGTIDISDNMINIKNNDDSPFKAYMQIRMNEDTYNFSPYFWWSFNGNIADEVSVEIVEKGVLLKSETKIDMTVIPSCYVLDDKGKLQYTHSSVVQGFASALTEIDSPVTYDSDDKIPEINRRYINSQNNVLVTVNNKNKIVCYIDDNNDDVYDVEILKGDVNYDGKIDASDASAVLNRYATLSTSSESVLTDMYTMDFSGDNKINAVDASLILSLYTDNATK